MTQSVRVFVLLFTLAVLAIAFAQGDEANVPPREGCTFDDGRTTCIETSAEVETQGIFDGLPVPAAWYGAEPSGTCDADPGPEYVAGVYMAFFYTEVYFDVQRTNVYRGNSHRLESSVELERTFMGLGPIEYDEVYCEPVELP